MATIAERLESAVASVESDSSKLHSVVHGTETAPDVVTEGGSIKTVAKVISQAEQSLANKVTALEESATASAAVATAKASEAATSSSAASTSAATAISATASASSSANSAAASATAASTSASSASQSATSAQASLNAITANLLVSSPAENEVLQYSNGYFRNKPQINLTDGGNF